jgi:hypothetical protein
MHNHIPPTAQAATAETISNWFEELAEVAFALVGDRGNRSPDDLAPRLQALVSVGTDIAASVVIDLNRIATALEKISRGEERAP